MILERLAKWSPFRIDALGLVTMLGAEEVDKAVGRLTENPYVEYLPLLAAFVVSGNRFVQPMPGCVLYNISDGIMATDVAGWLARWLTAQKLNWNTTTFVWSVRHDLGSVWQTRIPALIIGSFVHFVLILLSILTGDWFGFSNAVAMAISVFVRLYLVQQNRDFLDHKANSLKESDRDLVKVLCLIPDGRAVTLLAPRGIVKDCFLTTPRPLTRPFYDIARSLGWLGFGCHVICIGQSNLFIQILTVVTLILATVIFVRGFCCNELQIGRRMNILRLNPSNGDDARSIAYARLRLSSEEEAAMLAWSLFPQRSNQPWWKRYESLKLVEQDFSRLQPLENGDVQQQGV